MRPKEWIGISFSRPRKKCTTELYSTLIPKAILWRIQQISTSPTLTIWFFAILSPIISDFRRSTGRWVRLRREMVLASVDSETGGEEEFVVVDLVSVTDQKFVLMVEAKRSSLGKAMKQCLLTMRDMRENNGSGVVYGFVTVGESWRMIRYDGREGCVDEQVFGCGGLYLVCTE
ncbi:hypothetical protein BDZ91DRAFT_211689 [Kalaharituber pfeilii]|nr:hypothetical protein BDZ91DRAFT_211689 [Kalaharituber pfeilii]